MSWGRTPGWLSGSIRRSGCIQRGGDGGGDSARLNASRVRCEGGHVGSRGERRPRRAQLRSCCCSTVPPRFRQTARADPSRDCAGGSAASYQTGRTHGERCYRNHWGAALVGNTAATAGLVGIGTSAIHRSAASVRLRTAGRAAGARHRNASAGNSQRLGQGCLSGRARTGADIDDGLLRNRVGRLNRFRNRAFGAASQDEWLPRLNNRRDRGIATGKPDLDPARGSLARQSHAGESNAGRPDGCGVENEARDGWRRRFGSSWIQCDNLRIRDDLEPSLPAGSL